VVLESLYGSGIKAIGEHLGLPPDPWIPEEVWSNGRVREAHWGHQAAKDIYQAVFSAIPITEQFMKDGKQIAKDHQVAYTMAGRIVPIPSGFYDGRFSVQAHKWINYCVSGSANDEISRAIVTARRAGMGHLVWIGMHDELVHASSISREIQHIMQTPSARFCQLAKRVPVIRTDQEFMGKRWVKPE
jgi:DNA polymerase I-like protein with 3'-5' exonuclease and polymerase domains